MKMMRIVAYAAAWALADPGIAAWREASSPHFVIYSQQAPETLRAYAEKLERFDALLRRLQNDDARIVRPSDRLTIYALPSQAAVEKVMAYKGAAGVYHANFISTLALTSLEKGGAWALDAQIVLLHEYTHHFMLHYHPGTYPGWFMEGYAEFFSTTKFEPNGNIGVGLPANHRAYALAAADSGMLTTRALLEERPSTAPGMGELRASKGWLLIHFLTFEPKRDGQLGAFLKALDKGEKPIDAGTRIFGNLGDLDNQLHSYLRRNRLNYLNIAAPKLETGKIEIRELGPAEDAILPLRIDTRYGVGQKEAQRIVTQAQAVAARYPEDPSVLCELAEAEDDAGNADASDAAADRLLKIDPKSLCAMIFKGRAVQRRAFAAHALPADRIWSGARNWFAKANQADLDHPWPLALYYLSYRTAKAKPTANAIAGLLAAQDREPGDPRLRTFATIELLRQNKPDEARAMMAPLVNVPHGRAGETMLGIYARIGSADPAMLADEIEGFGRRPAPAAKD